MRRTRLRHPRSRTVEVGFVQGQQAAGEIPSHDAFGRVFPWLDPDEFRACFLARYQ